MMFTDEGKFWVALVMFLIGIFASGYFMGWGREKLSGKIFDKMLEYLNKANYWRGRFEGKSEDYADLLELYVELKEYTLEQVSAEHVPLKYGGELE